MGSHIWDIYGEYLILIISLNNLRIYLKISKNFMKLLVIIFLLLKGMKDMIKLKKIEWKLMLILGLAF